MFCRVDVPMRLEDGASRPLYACDYHAQLLPVTQHSRLWTSTSSRVDGYLVLRRH